MENEIEKAKELLRKDEERKMAEFIDKVNQLSKEYGFSLQVKSEIVITKI